MIALQQRFSGLSHTCVAASNLNIIKPGTTPNETISANESNCFPIGELALSALAAKPSKKSKTKAAKRYSDA